MIALVGNKLDLVNSEEDTEHERQVPEEDAKSYANDAGLLFMETSAKTSDNVDAIFTEIGRFVCFILIAAGDRTAMLSLKDRDS